MARASEASKEQIKAMAPKEHSNENPSLHEIQYYGKQKKNSPRQPGSGPTSQQGNCKFCGSSHLRSFCPAFGKTCGYCQRKDHFARVCRKKLVGKQCMPWLKSQTTATLELICLHFQWNKAANGPVRMTGTSCLRSLVLT